MVDEQLVRLDVTGICAQGHVDDLAIVIRARDANPAKTASPIHPQAQTCRVEGRDVPRNRHQSDRGSKASESNSGRQAKHETAHEKDTGQGLWPRVSHEKGLRYYLGLKPQDYALVMHGSN